MIRRTSPAHSGITLTEILISILILGVGIISVATLFPLGVLRLREANRQSRSGFLVESAANELGTRNLLSKMTFLTSGWYSNTFPGGSGAIVYDPWLQDTQGPVVPTGQPAYRGWGGDGISQGSLNSNLISGPGLPVAYDPLWWSMAGLRTNGYLGEPYLEARFATGVSAAGGNLIRTDPNPHTSQTPPDPNSGFNGIYGLPRLTNVPQLNLQSAGPPPVYSSPDNNLATSIFVSPEDVIWQTQESQQFNGSVESRTGPVVGASQVVPDMNMSTGFLTTDFRYTWMFTGFQADSEDDNIIEGSVVVLENRPFALDPNTGSAAGEPVVEAIFGYTGPSNIIASPGNSAVGYAPQPSQVVVLRWPNTIADADIRVGSWIADVTYERYYLTDLYNFYDAVGNPPQAGQNFPSQRCYWYQVAKRSQAGPDILNVANYRSMTVWVSTPLQAYTLLYSATDPNGNAIAAPYHTNVALVSPYVVNVFPRTVYTRNSR